MFSFTLNSILGPDKAMNLYNCHVKHMSRLTLFVSTVKPVLSGHSKIDKSKVLKTKGSLMEVESIAECSLGAFCNTFDLH